MHGIIDTHFHMDMYKNYEEVFRFLNQEKQYTLCMTNSPGVFLSCKNIFSNSQYVKFALGFHPLNSDLKKKDLADFMYLLPQTEYVGEIGLDFTKRKGISSEQQIEYFEKIIEASTKSNQLMSIHVRNAEKEAFDILNRYQPKKCILHWYTGSKEYLDKFLDIGCYFSLNANMIKDINCVINEIPRKRILIESDGPYSKVNGVKYKPQLLKAEYEIIAKAINEPKLIQIVYDNFKTILTK